ncbi:MAG: endonuclease/exonuclease/phosphatase family protein [Lachnospiraceae bacterium]|nr:endonuclease/exonuclease/phosphatase family protein [Lachnospiraceae bacterium]
MTEEKIRHSRLRRFLKVLFIIVLVVVIAVAAFIGYLTVTEYKPSDIEQLKVVNKGTETGASKELTLMTWNIGYGALGDDADFFMDGGKKVSTATKKQVRSHMYSITKQIRQVNPDVVFLQEVDTDAQRSHFVNEKTFVENNTKNYSDTFALNYRCAFVPYPMPPIGKVEAGIQTLSKLQINSAERVALPCPFTWPTRVANLKRCITINRASANGGTDNLSLVNLHLEAYDDGSGKAAQTKILRNYLDQEYKSGNYVIAAGDFNQSFSSVDTSMYPAHEGLWKCGELDCSEFSSDWQFEMDTTHPSCRSLDKPYADADKSDFQYYMIDGFIVSKNVKVEKVETLDLGFKNSDHNPVVMTVELQ